MILFKCSITNEDTTCKSAGTLRGTLSTERGIYYFIDTTIEKMMSRIIAKLVEVESCIKGTDGRFCLNCGLLNTKHTTQQLFDCMQSLRVKNGLNPVEFFAQVEKPIFNCPPVSTRKNELLDIDDMAKIANKEY